MNFMPNVIQDNVTEEAILWLGKHVLKMPAVSQFWVGLDAIDLDRDWCQCGCRLMAKPEQGGYQSGPLSLAWVLISMVTRKTDIPMNIVKTIPVSTLTLVLIRLYEQAKREACFVTFIGRDTVGRRTEYRFDFDQRQVELWQYSSEPHNRQNNPIYL